MGDRGIAAAGWDPWFAPDRPRTPADVVNIGFVLTVIEDLDERRQALRGCSQSDRKARRPDCLRSDRVILEQVLVHRFGNTVGSTVSRSPSAANTLSTVANSGL